MSASDLGMMTFLRSYAKDGEDFEGNVNRYLNFWTEEYPELKDSISAYGYALHKRLAVGSMRLAQHAGDSVRKDNARAYNCSYVAPETPKDFGDILYLLCCGCGVGIGLYEETRLNYPIVTIGDPKKKHQVADTKEGWAEAIVMLLENPLTVFDYSLLRPAGSRLVSSGGYASGPEPLVEGIECIRNILLTRLGEHLLQEDLADIACHIAKLVVSGGSRRSALIICYDDPAMDEYKQGDWFEVNDQRNQANISRVVTKGSEEASEAIDTLFETLWGEPAVVLSKDKSNYKENIGVNPCVEISLRSRSFCNLSSVVASNCTSTEEFLYAAEAAAFFGTLQASLTSFDSIDPRWRENAEDERLIGVSITGQAMTNGLLTPEVLREGVSRVRAINEKTAELIGIKPAARLTCIKPEGSLSAVMGCSSGIHAAFGEFTIRRIRVNRLSELGQSLINAFGISSDKYGFIVDDVYSKTDVCLQFPCEFKNAIYRKDETSLQLLERMRVVYENWVKLGHNSGQETNNVSITVNYKPEEKDEVKAWMKNNQDCYRGISVLPYNGGSYTQTPFEEVTEEEFKKYVALYPKLDFNKLGIKSNIKGSVACSGGSCEISSL